MAVAARKQIGFRITPDVRKEIISIIDGRIKEAHVTREDFSELKEIVRDISFEGRRTSIAQRELAEAQKESQKEISRLDKTMQELAQAQKRTEVKVEELTEAQKKTEIEIQKLTNGLDELRDDVSDLTRGLKATREDLGGLSRSFSYAFENEAYRMIPGFLKNNYGIEMTERMVRKEIGGKEINVFGKAKRKGKNVLIVGEARVRLEKKKDEKKNIFEELENKVKAVEKTSKEEIVQILLTHYATEKFIKEAKHKGIIVIQSFEW